MLPVGCVFSRCFLILSLLPLNDFLLSVTPFLCGLLIRPRFSFLPVGAPGWSLVGSRLLVPARLWGELRTGQGCVDGAAGAKLSFCLWWGSGAPVGGDCLAAIIMRALPCTRKGHRPLTRIGAKLSFCLWWGSGAPVGGVPYGNKKRKTDVLLCGVRFAPVGKDYTGSALHPQGTSSLDPGIAQN